MRAARGTFRASCILLFTLLAALPAAGQERAPRLLGATVAAEGLPRANDVATLRSRVVAPDREAIDRLARRHASGTERLRFVLDLFADAEYEAEVVAAEVRASGTTVFARVVDVPLGSAVLTHEAGVLVASISMPRANYVIERWQDERYRVARIAEHLLGSEAPPIVAIAPARNADARSTPDIPADSGRLIDVMIVWTPAAQTAAGGQAAMEARAQAAVDHGNLVYLNSGVAQRLRLVHRQQVTYTERASGCTHPDNSQIGVGRIQCALYDVTGTTDGKMDEVHALRNAHGADLVALLIVRIDAITGQAWMPLPPSAATSNRGFAAIAWDVAITGKAFVHELGHTMGANHDAYSTPGPSLYAYSHGYADPDAGWRTVMALSNACDDFEPFDRSQVRPQAVPCPPIDYLSNPNVTYGPGATPTGLYWESNNAHTLNKTAKIIAAYRPAVYPIPQRFADVAPSHPFYGYIEFFGQAGVTTGCGAGLFCPDASVNRDQMAVFLERVKHASNWTPPVAGNLFADVPAAHPFADWIAALYNDGITSGCTAVPLQYCPLNPVTRGQMAVFVLRASCGASYVPAAPAAQRFDDVPPSHPFYAFIDKFARLGVTSGCNATSYCPDTSVTRGQMAVFIERSFPFLTPSDTCSP